MDLFDILRCDYPLPDAGYQTEEFQTKDLGQALNLYTITRHGRLVRQERTHRLLSVSPDPKGRSSQPATDPIPSLRSARTKPTAEDTNHHGDVRFYLTGPSKEWVEYVARFTHGDVESIHRAEPPGRRIEPLDLAGIEEVVDTAEWAKSNILETCFKALRLVDEKLADTAVEVLGSEEQAARWLATPNQSLSGSHPYGAAATGRRFEVLKVLNWIEHGIPG